MAPDNITIVTVCYNSDGVIGAMLASIPEGVPVVLVDNASPRPLEPALPHGRPGLTVIRNIENRGFGRACNQGAAAARTRFVLFLNPDAQLQPETLPALLAARARHPEASAFNPRLATPDGRPLFKRDSLLLPRSMRMPRECPPEDHPLPFLVGAAIFMERSTFEAVGGFDENIFLYYEDDDLGLRLAADHGPIMFIHDALVLHEPTTGSGSSPEIVRFKAYHMARARVYAKRKHGRFLPFVSALSYAVTRFVKPRILRSAEKRGWACAFLSGVLSTLRDGGRYGALNAMGRGGYRKGTTP